MRRLPVAPQGVLERRSGGLNPENKGVFRQVKSFAPTPFQLKVRPSLTVCALTDQTFALADNLRFLKALMTRPKNVGAIVPSSPALTRAIAAGIDLHRTGPILELGPGTGVITQAILERGIAPERLTLIEYDAEMASHLAHKFPRTHVVQGDAFDLERTLGNRHGEPYAAIVSGLPLLNFPVTLRNSYMAGLIDRLEHGAPVIQFSYGTQAPVEAPPGCSVNRAALIWANIPPARVWIYRKN